MTPTDATISWHGNWVVYGPTATYARLPHGVSPDLGKNERRRMVDSVNWLRVSLALAQLGGLRFEEIEAATGLPGRACMNALAWATRHHWIIRRPDGEISPTDLWDRLVKAIGRADQAFDGANP